MGRGRAGGWLKWDKAYLVRPNHNIISSDFPRYQPQPWKFMEGPSLISYLLSYEYQRMWLEERDGWKKRMYPENTTENVDVVKRYILSFKNNPHPKPEKKKEPFKMKKFQSAKKTFSTKRPPGDKAMSFEKKSKPREKEEVNEKPT